MTTDLQKASLLKRVSAWVLDAILFCVLAVGFIWMLSGIVGYNTQSEKLEAYYHQYETAYQTSFGYTQEEYEALSEAEKQTYNAAYEAMVADEDVMYTYQLVLNLSLLMVCIGVLLAKLLLEFVVPLLFKNGQTVGKRIFGLAVMRTNGVQVGGVSLFIRAVLGKYAIETMIPVFIVMMWLLSLAGIGGTVVLFVLLLLQAGLLIATPTNSLIHDKLADTVVVEMASQMIFESEEHRLAHQQRIAAEKAERSPY